MDIETERRFNILICERIMSDVVNNKGMISREYLFIILLLNQFTKSKGI